MSEHLNVMLKFYQDNDRMIETVERVNDSYLEMLDALEVLEAENAKLLNLVRFIMHQCNDSNPRCSECIDWNGGECVALQRLRELGIEVTE